MPYYYMQTIFFRCFDTLFLMRIHDYTYCACLSQLAHVKTTLLCILYDLHRKKYVMSAHNLSEKLERSLPECFFVQEIMTFRIVQDNQINL